MCLIPKAPKAPVIPERQAAQTPQDPVDARTGINARRRRGMWAAIMTSPSGTAGPPATTGTPGY